jgi:hypothetical protein
MGMVRYLVDELGYYVNQLDGDKYLQIGDTIVVARPPP